MSRDPLAALAERQHWIGPLEQPLQDAVHRAFDVFGEARDGVRDALHGTWLHEPLHAVLTDVPVGSWTATVVFDSLAALGAGQAMDVAADATVVVGLVGAVGAALTGMNDWAEAKGASRRIGAVHGLLNVAALGLFGASWVARRKPGTRGTARTLAALGYVVVGASAHLGGNLVYEQGMGVATKTKKAPARRRRAASEVPPEAVAPLE
ncbi:MAG TPA: DUF2231 domain-containing protein [Acidobacteriaceae bacterium]